MATLGYESWAPDWGSFNRIVAGQTPWGQVGGGAGATAPLPPGYITGPRGSEGALEVGYKPPGWPDPAESAALATKGNIANMPNLTDLYGKIANTYVPGYAGLSGQESANIARLLNPAPLDPRYIAEAGGGLGISGSPAASELGYRMTHNEWLKDVLAGSNMLSGAAQRGRGIYDLSGAMTTPAQEQQAREEATILANAPNPAAAYNQALRAAAMGLQAGAFSQRGGLGGRSAFGTGSGGSVSDIADMVQRIMQKYSPTAGTASSGGSAGVPYYGSGSTGLNPLPSRPDQPYGPDFGINPDDYQLGFDPTEGVIT